MVGREIEQSKVRGWGSVNWHIFDRLTREGLSELSKGASCVEDGQRVTASVWTLG